MADRKKGNGLMYGALIGAVAAGIGYLAGKYNAQPSEEQQQQNGRRFCNEEGSECCICLGDMKAIVTLPCGHTIHAACARKMKEANGRGSATCPLCRRKFQWSDINM